MQAFRLIPSIEQLRQRPSIRALEARFGGAATVEALRAAAASVRDALTAESLRPDDGREVAERIESLAASTLAASVRLSLRTVINATGVILHTNLGRAPLSRAAVDRV